MYKEIELKLILDEKLISQVATSQLVIQQALAGPITQHLISTYFDTSDFQLRKNKYSLRIRQTPDDFWQTLKTASKGRGGVTERYEWESPVQALQIEEDQLPISFTEQPIWNEVKNNLQPLFRSDFTRSAWELSLGNGSLVELAVDHGWVETENDKSSLVEVELELKAGYSYNIYDCALLLLTQVPVSIGYLSKAARGFSLLKNKDVRRPSSFLVDINSLESEWEKRLSSIGLLNNQQWLSELPLWQHFLSRLHIYAQGNPSPKNTYWQLIVMRWVHDLLDLASADSGEVDGLLTLMEGHAKVLLDRGN